jgi:hypothetical protein
MATTITNDYNITNDANDGGMVFSFVDNSLNYAPQSYDLGNGRGGWFRFTGIDIPNGATITSAVLEIYATMNTGLSPESLPLYLDTRISPGNPPNITAIRSPAYATACPAFPTIPSTTLATTRPLYNNTNYKSCTSDVTNEINALLGNWPNLEELVFYTNGKNFFTTTNTAAAVYNRDWGTNKSANLEIKYQRSDKTVYRFV